MDGRMRSGVTVAMRMWSTSAGVRPPASSARCAARSALERTCSGSARPVPTMVAPRGASGLGIQAPQEVADVLVHALLHERGRAQHARADGARVRAAVADEDDAVDAQ